MDLWTSPADRRAPFGACGQPVDNAPPRSHRWASAGVAHGLPTLARLSPTTPQLGNKFFLLEEEKSRNCKKGTFQLWVDKMRVVVERTDLNCYLRLVKRLTIQSGFRDTRFLRSR